jgi:sulfur relay (sulfurtransferase) DsrC/TusE family protein
VPRKHTVKIVKRARFVVGLPSAEQMIGLATEVKDDVKARILRAEDVDDRPAPKLKERTDGKLGYPHYKVVKYGGKPIRDWWRTGRTLRSMQVLRAGPGKAVIGFVDPTTNNRAFFNNRLWRQFGVSPRNRALIARRAPQLFKGQIVKVA